MVKSKIQTAFINTRYRKIEERLKEPKEQITIEEH